MIELLLNGERVRAPVRYASQTLLHFLRDKLGQTDVKDGCSEGDCGACAVIMDGKAVNACLVLALQANGRSILTLRGLISGDKLHPIQRAMVECGAIQCGFCTPGIVMAIWALLETTPNPSREQIREAISGNLCRCTGYQKIIDAVESVASELRKARV